MVAAGPGLKVDGTSVSVDWGQDSLGLQGSGVTQGRQLEDMGREGPQNKGRADGWEQLHTPSDTSDQATEETS